MREFYTQQDIGDIFNLEGHLVIVPEALQEVDPNIQKTQQGKLVIYFLFFRSSVDCRSFIFWDIVSPFTSWPPFIDFIDFIFCQMESSSKRATDKTRYHSGIAVALGEEWGLPTRSHPTFPGEQILFENSFTTHFFCLLNTNYTNAFSNNLIYLSFSILIASISFKWTHRYIFFSYWKYFFMNIFPNMTLCSPSCLSQ